MSSRVVAATSALGMSFDKPRCTAGAVTRTKKRTRVVGSEETVRAAVQHRAVRAGGLRQRLGPALRQVSGAGPGRTRR